MPMPIRRMDNTEKSLIRRMHFEQGLSPAKVAELVGRSPSSVGRLLAQKRAPKPIGRPAKLSEARVDGVVKTLERMVDEADATWEVSMAMLMRRARLKCCAKVVAKALHQRGYRFRDLRYKPILTPVDVRERFAWAKQFRGKSADWWRRTVHIHLDNKVFKVATTAAGRKLLAKRTVRGVYRRRGKSLRPGHVKPHPKMRLPLGSKGILKAGGVGSGKVLVWHTITENWGGEQAASLYRDVVLPALSHQYPGKRAFRVLEDNDPTGNKSKKGVAAKAWVPLRQ